MDIKERLKKIYVLSVSGIEGEKENAQKILTELCLKYKVKIEDIQNEDEKENFYYFRYKDDMEERLLLQIIYKVIGSADKIHDIKGVRRRIKEFGAECTYSQSVDIEILFELHKRLWHEEQKWLMRAYIEKHKLFGKKKDGKPNETLSKEDLIKLDAMISALSDEKITCNKMIENKKVERR